MNQNELVEYYSNLCRSCGHHQSTHFYQHQVMIVEIGCCAIVDVYVDESGKHREKVCQCMKFDPYTPIEICELVENELEKVCHE